MVALGNNIVALGNQVNRFPLHSGGNRRTVWADSSVPGAIFDSLAATRTYARIIATSAHYQAFP